MKFILFVIAGWILFALLGAWYWYRLKRAEPAMTDEHPLPRRRASRGSSTKAQ